MAAIDDELKLIGSIMRHLDELDEQARIRVLGYLIARYGAKATMEVKQSMGPGMQCNAPAYADLATSPQQAAAQSEAIKKHIAATTEKNESLLQDVRDHPLKDGPELFGDPVMVEELKEDAF